MTILDQDPDFPNVNSFDHFFAKQNLKNELKNKQQTSSEYMSKSKGNETLKRHEIKGMANVGDFDFSTRKQSYNQEISKGLYY